MVEPDGAWAPMLLWRSATLMPLMPIKQSAVQTLAVKAAFSSVSTSPVATDRKRHGSHSVPALAGLDSFRDSSRTT